MTPNNHITPFLVFLRKFEKIFLKIFKNFGFFGSMGSLWGSTTFFAWCCLIPNFYRIKGTPKASFQAYQIIYGGRLPYVYSPKTVSNTKNSGPKWKIYFFLLKLHTNSTTSQPYFWVSIIHSKVNFSAFPPLGITLIVPPLLLTQFLKAL